MLNGNTIHGYFQWLCQITGGYVVPHLPGEGLLQLLNCQIECRKECQKECQIEGQIEYRCQKESKNRCQTECQK